MSTRGDPTTDLNIVREQLIALLASPVQQFAAALLEFVDSVLAVGDTNSERATLLFARALLSRVPTKFSDRFYVDAYLIQSIGEIWSNGQFHISKMVIPSYYSIWGYEFVDVPNVRSDRPRRVHFIYMPATNAWPHLFEYVWLFHEIGHCLLSQHGQQFFDQFTTGLQNILAQLRIRSIADTGIARARADATIKEIEEYWKPSSEHNGWAREIAVDVIALWACGPAYIEVFCRAHREVGDPYLVEPAHPPVELRTRALIASANMLGWFSSITELEALSSRWENGLPTAVSNRYIALRNADAISSVVNAALKYCRLVGVKLLEADDLKRIENSLDPEHDYDNAVELIVAAWLVNSNHDAESYAAWEARVLELLESDVRP